jgi:hypothetical protein
VRALRETVSRQVSRLVVSAAAAAGGARQHAAL